jgi:hypothetical protein
MQPISIVQWFDIHQVGFLFEPSLDFLTMLAASNAFEIIIEGTESYLDKKYFVTFDKVNQNNCGTNFLLSNELYVAYLPEMGPLPKLSAKGKFNIPYSPESRLRSNNGVSCT